MLLNRFEPTKMHLAFDVIVILPVGFVSTNPTSVYADGAKKEEANWLIASYFDGPLALDNDCWPLYSDFSLRCLNDTRSVCAAWETYV